MSGSVLKISRFQITNLLGDAQAVPALRLGISLGVALVGADGVREAREEALGPDQADQHLPGQVGQLRLQLVLVVLLEGQLRFGRRRWRRDVRQRFALLQLHRATR